ncbi:hypothetical protein LJR231_002926 [Phyllobacterium sp. LjRoot231]|uniref:hypothetical protein n=1 Tax=Phyllobacterium sp. LjRoot231 TaxID=3342289 RepID=UPI003ED02EA2
MTEFDPEAIFAGHRQRYLKVFQPLFLPTDPISNDIICYFASLLRVLGMEDKGWDPYAESRHILNDLNRLMKVKLPKKKFPDSERTMWRLGLLLYSHIVVMDAPYEVITNLLRFQLGKGFSPNPFFDLLTEKEKKSFRKNGIRTGRKIQIIKALSNDVGLAVGDLYDEFYNSQLRNAVQHSDFILTDEDFRSRSGISGTSAFKLNYDELDALITKAKAFIAAYLQAEMTARQVWGMQKSRAIPYDSHYKGLMEVLVDERDLLCGFAVHWPNNSQSLYRRTEEGVEMVNCLVDLKRASIDLWVDRYARNPGSFSPLVEHDAEPVYTLLDKSAIRPIWPTNL